MKIAVIGDVGSLSAAEEALLFDRASAVDPAVRQVVAGIIDDVRARGDEALRAQAERFDGVELATVEVSRAAIEHARRALAPDLRAAMDSAAHAIAAFHRAQLPAEITLETRPGVRLGRRIEPLHRVGVYAPGGRAAYPSSVLMGVVPARVAGVEEVVVCSPPGPGGLPSPLVLAAAAIAGADRVFALGGAGAVAAMALGTESFPRVDKVVGPGNVYVTEAKRQLAGVVASDCPAGPSELLVIADETADPRLVAAELLAQAEHDPAAAVVLISTDGDLPPRVRAALDTMLAEQPRAAIVRQSLAARGALLTAGSLETALDLAARYAPEHLLLLVADPQAALARVRGAGTVFLGAGSSVAFGDYLTGANHVLPTAGAARAWGGLSTLDFVRLVTWQEVTPAAASELATPTALLAEAEGLPGHALAARLRWTDTPATPAALERPRARPSLADVSLYRGAGSAVRCAVDLADNTNLFGLPPAARRILDTAGDELLTRYPSPYAEELRRSLAGLLGVPTEAVTTGCGSDDLLDAVLRAFCAPGDALAYPVPTFGIVPSFARVSGAVPRPVPLREDLSPDVEGLLSRRAAVTYLCRPNNPTGTLWPRAVVEELAAASRGLVLVDEAYVDFAAPDEADGLAGWSVAPRNVIVLRTLSKAHGLAGMRVGYAIGPPELIAAVEKVRGPYKVGALAEAVAVAVLREDRGWVADAVALARAARERLRAELRERGLRPLPSSTNFLFAPVPRRFAGAEALAAALRERQVAVRAFPALPVIGDGIRITVGPWPLIERFLAALDNVAGEADVKEEG